MDRSAQKSLDNYLLGKTIGKGTFGKVKKAIHKVSGEPVAIKILQKDKIKDISDVQRINRQLHILKIVRHASIAQLYEIIETPEIIFIVMQFAENGQFFDYIMDGNIKSEQQGHHYFIQILEGLEYLHNCKIAHRDIKPQNMLLDTNAKVKIVDFGLSNMYSKGQKLLTACGSSCYASPQMIKGQQYDPQLTDIWSLGIVLYTMIFAKLPFEDDNTSILYSKIKSGLFIIERKISPQLKSLLNGLICVKPSSRLTLKGIKNHPWVQNKPIYQPTFGIVIGHQKIPIDNLVLDQLIYLFSKMKIEIQKQKAKRQIQSNVKNAATATYYILLKRNYKNGMPSLTDICFSQFDKKLLKMDPKKSRIVRHKSFNVMAYYAQTQNFSPIYKKSENNNIPVNIQPKLQKQQVLPLHRRVKSLAKSHNYDEQRVKDTEKKNAIIHQIYLPKKLGRKRLRLNKSQQKSQSNFNFLRVIQQQDIKKLIIEKSQQSTKNVRLKTQGNQDIKDTSKKIKNNNKPYQTFYFNRRYSQNNDGKRISISISIEKNKKKMMNEKIKENPRYQKQKKQLDIGMFWKKRSVETNVLTRKTNKSRA